MTPSADRTLRVFVSSTLGELAAERSAARAAIESLRLIPVMLDATREKSDLDGLSREGSDVFIGVYWESFSPDLGREYAMAADQPRLVYVKEPASRREPELWALLGAILDSGVDSTVVAGADDLADKLTGDLARLLASRLPTAGRRLPTGTVTFWFADVEGSTSSLERHGRTYSELLGRFRRESESLLTRTGGTLVKTEGDGIFAVFGDAGAAVETAIEAQRVYLAYPEPGPLKVRIGIHSGNGLVVEGDYAGLDVHRAARVGAAAHGGQIVISATTRELLSNRDGIVTTDLGWFVLRGITRAEHLHQVAAPGLPTDFPPVRAQPSARARPPRQLTSLVGREADIEAVAALLEKEVRLLTLTGPGGIGKTRLAVAVTERLEPRYRDGIGFVSLAAVADSARVPETIAVTLGRTIEGTASAEDIIVDELRDRAFLLVLDNLEQVADCATLMARLLGRLPQLQLLVTSRIALQLSVEREYAVAPLEVPSAGAASDSVAGSAAVRLLVDRARTIRPDLRIDEKNATAVAELVRRLDGIPLAIELAAARFRLLEPEEVLRRMASGLDLGAGAVDLPARQRTLRAAIDWSFRLLAPSEQIVFARLGVFVDGWTLSAAEAIAGGAGVGDVATALDTLAAHSLIRLESVPSQGVRMRLLGPLQDYAAATLTEHGELETLRERHSAYFEESVENYPRGSGVGLGDWQRRMDLEWGNIHAAIVWCVRQAAYERLGRFLAALWPLLWQEDRVEEARGWLDQLRPHLGSIDPALRGQVIHVDGFFALEVGDFGPAVECGLEAIAVADEVGDDELKGRSMLIVAGSLPAFDLFDPRISQFITDAIAIFRRRGDTVDLTYALNFQCAYLASIGNLKAAAESIEEALVLATDIEALPIKAQSSSALAFVRLLSGDLDGAEQCLDTAVKALASTPNREVMSYVLDGYGWWALAQGRDIEGLTALGAAEGLRARVGLRTWPLSSTQFHLFASLADSYDDPDVQAARRAGRDLTPEAALAVVTSTPAVAAR